MALIKELLPDLSNEEECEKVTNAFGKSPIDSLVWGVG
jgi:hypothetical protein